MKTHQIYRYIRTVSLFPQLFGNYCQPQHSTSQNTQSTHHKGLFLFFSTFEIVRYQTMLYQRDDLFRPLSVGETLGRIVSVAKSREGWPVLFSISAAITAVMFLIRLILLVAVSKGALSEVDFEDPNSILEPAIWIQIGISSLLCAAPALIGAGALTKAVADLHVGPISSSWKSYIAFGVKRLPSLCGAGLLFTIGVSLGFILLYFPGLYLVVSWALYSPVIVVENRSPVQSLKRSWNLVKERRCYLFCVALSIGFFYIIVQMILNAIFLGAGADMGKTMFSVPGIMLLSLFSLLVMPLGSIVDMVIYVNMRVQKEGLVAERLRSELGGEGSEDSDLAVSLIENESVDVPDEDPEVTNV